MSSKQDRIIQRLAQTKRLVINALFFVVALANLVFYKKEMGKLIYVWVPLALIFGLFLSLGIKGRIDKKKNEH